jgi:hypothetical protein
MNHSPEPWLRRVDVLCDANDRGVLEATPEQTVGAGEQLAVDLDRIVLCVNACQGIPTEDLNGLTGKLHDLLYNENYR